MGASNGLGSSGVVMTSESEGASSDQTVRLVPLGALLSGPWSGGRNSKSCDGVELHSGSILKKLGGVCYPFFCGSFFPTTRSHSSGNYNILFQITMSTYYDIVNICIRCYILHAFGCVNLSTPRDPNNGEFRTISCADTVGLGKCRGLGPGPAQWPTWMGNSVGRTPGSRNKQIGNDTAS